MRRVTREVVTDRIAMTSALRSWLCEQLLKAVSELNRSSEEHIFAYPPASYSLPDYKLKVKHPMDLETMSRHARDVYCSVDEIETDMELMVKNCRIYNGEGALYDTYGQNLLRDSKVMFASIREQFAKQEKLYPDQVEVLRRISKRHLESHPLRRNQQTTAKRLGSRTPTPPPPAPAPQQRKQQTASSRQSQKQVQPEVSVPVKRVKREPVVTTTTAITTPGQYRGCNFIPHGPMLTQLKQDEQQLKQFSSSPRMDIIEASMGVGNSGKMWTTTAVINAFKKRITSRDYYRLDEKKSVLLILNGFVDDFNKAFTLTLLYPVERRAHEASQLEYDFANTTYADRYPVIFLVRFLVLLPLRLQSSTDYSKAKPILRVSQELLFFINKNWSLLNQKQESNTP